MGACLSPPDGPEDSSRGSSLPLFFHPYVKGSQIVMDETHCVAQRAATFHDGIVFSSRPVELGEKIPQACPQRLGPTACCFGLQINRPSLPSLPFPSRGASWRRLHRVFRLQGQHDDAALRSRQLLLLLLPEDPQNQRPVPVVSAEGAENSPRPCGGRKRDPRRLSGQDKAPTTAASARKQVLLITLEGSQFPRRTGRSPAMGEKGRSVEGRRENEKGPSVE